MALKEKAQILAIKKALSYMDKNPEENLPKLMDWFEKFDIRGALKKQLDIIRPAVSDPVNNWHQLVMSLWNDIDSEVRNTLFENLIINACLLGLENK